MTLSRNATEWTDWEFHRHGPAEENLYSDILFASFKQTSIQLPLSMHCITLH